MLVAERHEASASEIRTLLRQTWPREAQRCSDMQRLSGVAQTDEHAVVGEEQERTRRPASEPQSERREDSESQLALRCAHVVNWNLATTCAPASQQVLGVTPLPWQSS